MCDLPERNEGEEPVVGDAAQADRSEQQLERAATVVAATPLQLRVPDAPRVRERREIAQQHEGDDAARDEEKQPALRAEDRQRGAGEERPECDAEIAAGLEEGDPARSALAACVAREFHRFGMECADTEARDRREHQYRCVAVRDRSGRDACGRDRDPRWEQPRRDATVGDAAEDRLDECRCDGRRQHDRAGLRIGEMQHRFQEHEHRRQRARREVGGEMPEPELAHHAPSYSGPHRFDPSDCPHVGDGVVQRGGRRCVRLGRASLGRRCPGLFSTASSRSGQGQPGRLRSSLRRSARRR